MSCQERHDDLAKTTLGQFKKHCKDYNPDVPQAYYVNKYESKEGKRFIKYCNKACPCPELSAYHLCVQMEDLMWPDDYAAFLALFDQLVTTHIIADAEHEINISGVDKAAMIDMHGASKKKKKKK